MTWTRKHDAWLARECEGLDVWVNAGDGAICEYQDDSIPHYNTDPAACIRAAEEWREKEKGRWYEITSSCDMTTRRSAGYARCFSPMNMLAGEADGDFALAQALYRATGGPA